MTTDRLPCGCRHNGSEWTHWCEPCKVEHDARHAQALADYREQERRRDAATRYL